MPTDPTTQNLVARGQAFVALVSAIVGVVAAVQAFASKRDADMSAKEAQALKLALETRAADRADREARAKLDAIAYEAVVKVLELDRTKATEALAAKREKAVLALIGATASESMQSALFGVMQSGSSISEASRVEAAAASELLTQFGSQAADPSPQPLPSASSDTKPSQPSLLKGYRVVVFYCGSDARPRDTDVQKTTAERLVAEMSASPESRNHSIRWETKLLPSVLNNAPGYKIKSNQIRFNPSDGETEASISLLNLLGDSKTLKPLSMRFDRTAVIQRTPGYLSVFVCGLSADA